MSPRDIFDSIDDALYAVAHFTKDKPLKAIAAEMGVTDDRLRDMVDPTRRPRFAAAAIVPISKASQNYAAVRTLCHLVGGSFVLLPQSNAHEADLLGALGEVLREVGEDAEAIGRALANDGKLDHREAGDVLRELDESMAKLATLRTLVAGRVAPRKPGRPTR